MAVVPIDFLRNLPASQQASLLQQLMAGGLTRVEAESFFAGLSPQQQEAFRAEWTKQQGGAPLPAPASAVPSPIPSPRPIPTATQPKPIAIENRPKPVAAQQPVTPVSVQGWEQRATAAMGTAGGEAPRWTMFQPSQAHLLAQHLRVEAYKGPQPIAGTPLGQALAGVYRPSPEVQAAGQRGKELHAQLLPRMVQELQGQYEQVQHSVKWASAPWRMQGEINLVGQRAGGGVTLADVRSFTEGQYARVVQSLAMRAGIYEQGASTAEMAQRLSEMAPMEISATHPAVRGKATQMGIYGELARQAYGTEDVQYEMHLASQAQGADQPLIPVRVKGMDPKRAQEAIKQSLELRRRYATETLGKGGSEAEAAWQMRSVGKGGYTAFELGERFIPEEDTARLAKNIKEAAQTIEAVKKNLQPLSESEVQTQAQGLSGSLRALGQRFRDFISPGGAPQAQPTAAEVQAAISSGNVGGRGGLPWEAAATGGGGAAGGGRRGILGRLFGDGGGGGGPTPGDEQETQNIFGKFSPAWTAFRLRQIGYYTYGMPQRWAREAEPYQQAGLEFAIAGGAPYSAALASSAGALQVPMAEMRSFQQGLGVGAQRGQLGLYRTMGGAAGFERGQALGQIATPALYGLGAGWGVGLLAQTAGIGAAGPLGLIAGAGMAGAMYLGEAREAAEPYNVNREMLEWAQGRRGGPSFGARLGLGMRTLGALPEQGWDLLRARTAVEQEMGQQAQAFATGPEIQIAQADLHVKDLRLEGLDVTQSRQLATTIMAATGITHEQVNQGQIDQMMRQLAPTFRAMGGTPQAAQQMLSMAQQIGGAFGLAPSEQITPYLMAMPTTPAAQERQVIASQMLQPLAAATRWVPQPSELQNYAQMLATHTAGQVRTAAQAQRGYTGLEGIYTQVPGVGVQSQFAQGFYAGLAPTPTWLPEQARTVMGQLPGITQAPLPALQSGMYSEQLTRAVTEGGNVADVLRSMLKWPAEPGKGWQQAPGAGMGLAQGVSQVLQQGAWGGPGYSQGAVSFAQQMVGAWEQGGPSAMLLQAEGMQALTPFAQRFGWYGDRAFMRQDYLGEYQRLVPQIGQQAFLQGTQAFQGYGQIAQALGGLSGWGMGASQMEGRLLHGGVSPANIDRLASMAQYSTTPMGYSMMAGGWGGGQAMLGMRQAMGLPGLVSGAMPLYEQGPTGGYYPIGQLQQQQMARYQMQQAQQYQMGTGEWANWGGFQMGMLGDIQQQRMHLGTFQQVRGLQSQLFEANTGQQKRNLEYAMASATMQYRQSMESLGLQQQMWGLQTGFQRREFGFQYEQMQQQRQWGREDFAFNKQVAGLQYSWQQEDLDRGIRFATGREKEQLIRQRGRSEEMYTIQEGKRGKDEKRQEEVWKWEEERFSRQRQQFEEIKTLEAEQFAMRKRHLTEAYNLQMAHLQEQMDHLEEVTDIQRKINELQNNQQEQDMKYRLAEAERQASYYEKVVFPYQEKQLALQERMQEAQAKYMEQQIKDMSDGGQLWRAWDDFISWIEQQIRKIQNSAENAGGGAPGQGPGETLPEMAPFSRYTIADALTGKVRRENNISIGNISINIPPGNYGSPEDVARAVSAEFEAKMNSLAARQRQRGEPW